MNCMLHDGESFLACLEAEEWLKILRIKQCLESGHSDHVILYQVVVVTTETQRATASVLAAVSLFNVALNAERIQKVSDCLCLCFFHTE